MKQQQQNEQVLALAALAAQDKTSYSCPEPTDTEMADFIEGKISGQRREEILAYLRANPDAFRDWADTLDALETLEAPKFTQAPQVSESWWMQTLQRFADYIFSPTGAGLATATVMLLVTLTVIPIVRQTLSPFERNAQIITQSMKPGDLQHVLSDIPYADVSLGFVADSQNAQQALGEGVEYGRQALLGNTFEAVDWQSPWNSYYDFGQWLVLTWSVTKTGQELPAEFWQQQQVWFDQLKNELNAQKNVLDLENDLTNMQQAMSDLPNYEPLFRLSSDLLETLNPQQGKTP